MRVITWRPLREFAKRHPDAREPLRIWNKLMEASAFRNPSEVKRLFGGKVDFVKGSASIFDIGGNKYRLAVTIRYDLQRVYVRAIMTHAEYDRRTRDGTL